MPFSHGASVFSTQGKEVGRIDRVMIDPKTKKVTHIVIRKGFASFCSKKYDKKFKANATPP